MNELTELVLRPIGLFTGKPLAVGIALGILGCAAVLWLFIRFVLERRFLAQYWSLIRAIRKARKEAASEEDCLARVTEAFDGTGHAHGWRQYRAAIEFVDGRVYSYTNPAPFFPADRISAPP